jgi:hypothetical protein
MPPPEPTAGTTRSADKEGDGVALVHSLRGGHPGWGEEPSRQGEPSLAVVVEAAHGSLISAGDRPSAAVRSVCSSPSFSPLTTPCHWGPRSRAQVVSGPAAGDGSTPWVVVGS